MDSILTYLPSPRPLANTPSQIKTIGYAFKVEHFNNKPVVTTRVYKGKFKTKSEVFNTNQQLN